MRVSLAGLILCEVNFKAPKDKAAAKVDEVEEREEPPEVEVEETWVAWVFLEGWRLNCRALARAFSWVRTKLARF